MADINIKWEPFERELVTKVDQIVDMAKGSSGAVQTEADWKAVRQIFDLFVHYYPDKAQALYKTVKFLKSQQGDKRGIAKEGSAMIQHQMEVPQRFYELMIAVFPNQKWDRRFISKLVQIIPEVNATGAKI